MCGLSRTYRVKCQSLDWNSVSAWTLGLAAQIRGTNHRVLFKVYVKQNKTGNTADISRCLNVVSAGSAGQRGKSLIISFELVRET